MKFTLLVVALLVAAAMAAHPHGATRVLVAASDAGVAASSTQYIAQLRDAGYAVTLHVASDGDISLRKFGDYTFDHVVLLAQSAASFGDGLSADALLDFVDDGGSLLVAAQGAVSASLSEAAKDCGVTLPARAARVAPLVDFAAAVPRYADAVWVRPGAGGIVRDAARVAFKGQALKYTASNARLMAALVAADTAVHPRAEKLTAEPVAAAVALQALNGARMVFVGSTELFTAAAAAHGDSLAAAVDLSLWAFGERRVVRATHAKHFRIGEDTPADLYTIYEKVRFEVLLEEWDGAAWVPFVADDVQMDFTMLDPHVRATLTAGPNGLYFHEFQLPDVYGVFTFRVEYERRGYNVIDVIQRVPVRPLRHNQYERFIVAAYPYYTGSFSMMLGALILFFFFHFHRDAKA